MSTFMLGTENQRTNERCSAPVDVRVGLGVGYALASSGSRAWASRPKTRAASLASSEGWKGRLLEDELLPAHTSRGLLKNVCW